MKILYITVLLSFLSSYAQEKKRYFFDESDKPVTEEEFVAKIDHSINVDRVFSNDTVIVGKLYTRKVSGLLTAEELNYLRNYLKRISGREIDYKKVIVINFYPGLEEEENSLSKATIYDHNYKRKLNRIAKNEQFWVYASEENLQHQHSKKLNWKKDQSHYIENTFIPVYFHFGSFIIIHPSGNYIKYYGEYGKFHVWNTLKEIVTLYGTN